MTTEDEIRGDWSNVKGTHYHLLYALWLIVRNEGANVYFYEGNDLLARLALPSPIAPPDPTSLLETDDEPTIALHAERETSEIWIQLKSTKTGWSCSRLLEKNLLLNFICNGFQSEARNKTWRVFLITQGIVNQKEVNDFVKSPRRYSVLHSKLKQILQLAGVRLRNEGWSVSETKLSNLRRVAFDVLLQLSNSEPVALETLRSDINAELTRAYPDQELVKQLEDTLIGAIVRDASAGPESAHVYDSDWINAAAGKPIVNRGMFDQDPISACNAAVRQFVSEIGFEPQNFASRHHLCNALRQFMTSSKTVFVLIGLSGSGKSWACADWAVEDLSNELRLLIPGHDMDHHRCLSELVQNRLRSWTSAFWPAEQFLNRLANASELEGRKPFTAIIDNLIPVGDLGVYRRDLARLVAECRTRGFKMIVTCQRQLWELHQLGADIPSNEVFISNSEFSGSQVGAKDDDKVRAAGKGPVHSFLLSDFSPEEQTKALFKCLPPDTATEVANHFRLRAFSLLRSPYLMSRYLDLNGKYLEKAGELPPFNVHELVDTHVNSLLVRAASELSCSAGDIEPAFDALLERLWPNRQEGLPFNEALTCLVTKFPERSFELLTALRRVGLFSSRNPIRLDAHIADRLFAKRLLTNLQETIDGTLLELNPETDSGVASALIRDAAMDPISLAERFLTIDTRWAEAVALGLTQGSADDWRALALLTVLIGSKENHVLEAGYSGLGQLAVRGERAWKWVAELYLGDHAKTWYRGSRALANAIEYIPEHVEAAIRTRLIRLLHIDEIFSTNRDKRKSWLLNGSLDPLRGVTHQSSATTAARVVSRYRGLTGGKQDWDFTNDLDHARGRIALFERESDLKTLLDELRSDDGEARYRAAFALRVVVADRAALVKDEILTAVVKETNFQVLIRLLLISFHLIELYSDELLTAIKNSKAGNLSKPLVTTGITLSLLGNLASKNTDIVENILPAKLDRHPSWARAFSTEMFAYAWWRCAATSSSASHVLREISDQSISHVKKEYVPFAIRGNSIALLGLMSIELGLHSEELIGRQVFYPNQQRQFVYLETVEFFQKNVKKLITHNSFNSFIELLVQSVIKEELAQVYFHPVKQALFRCTSMCLELIAQTAAVMDDPLPLLNRLPRTWQATRVATRLLEMGRHDASFMDFARESFAGLKGGGTLQGLEERQQCQVQLALLDSDSRTALKELRETSIKSALLQTEGNSLGMAALAAKQPENLLSFIEDDFQDEHDLPTLYYLVEHARSWPTLLVARLYSRMFSSQAISRHEALDLCEQVLAAVRSLPQSSVREEYESLYLIIHKLLQGHVVRTERNQSRFFNRDNLICRSHQLAFEILAEPVKIATELTAKAQLKSFLYDERGRLETHFYELRHHLLLQGTSYLMYFFPAARLSLVGSAIQFGMTDPAGNLMKERSETTKLINEHSYLFHAARIDDDDKGRAKRALEDFEKRETLTPDDERLSDEAGALLLRMNRLTEAETALKRSLSRPLSRGGMRAHTLKNLACVYALVNDETRCRIALEEAARIEPLDQKWLSADTDLDAMRDTEWFKGLTANTTSA
jgi:hypothetical protein